MVHPSAQALGPSLSGRFHSFLVERETYLRELLRYVVLMKKPDVTSTSRRYDQG